MSLRLPLATGLAVLGLVAPAQAHDHHGWPWPGAEAQAPAGTTGTTGASGATGATGAGNATGAAGPAVPGTGAPITSTPAAPQTPPLVTTATVAGRTALVRTNGKAAIPRGAPQTVRAIIAAGNQIVGKPYRYGGGHARVRDSAYDCSGTVSYALIGAGLLTSPLDSGTLARWGAKGAGRWATIYANRDHVYMEVAGLRLDTSAMGDPAGGDGPRWRPVIGRRDGFKVRHAAGL